jgi:hypothetical protein
MASEEAMDLVTKSKDGRAVKPAWVDYILEVANDLGFGPDPEVVRGTIKGTPLIAAVRKLGGEIRPISECHHWVLQPGFRPERDDYQDLVGDLRCSRAGVNDFQGMVEIRFPDRTFLAARVELDRHPMHGDNATAFVGRNLEELLEFSNQVEETLAELARSGLRVYGTSAHVQAGQGVPEEDLVLPPSLQRGILEYLDSFWRSADLCRQMRIAPSRGVLFVGAPGTGKTLTVRHILGRFEQYRRFVFVNDSPGGSGIDSSQFQHLVLELGSSRDPALVVIEDIDRILESGAVTPQFLLNVLDGLFEPDCPVLWVATSNDPTGLEANLLDRPGRFDRIFVFPKPGYAERIRLVERFSPWLVSQKHLEEIAGNSDGLTPAHIREVCYTAALRAAEDPDGYPEALREELNAVREQHQRAGKYANLLNSEQTVGFAG